MAVKRHIETFVEMQIIAFREKPFAKIVFLERGMFAILFLCFFHIRIITRIL